MGIRDELGAFCPHGRIERQDRQDGALAGLTFAVKDLFDIAGVPTGAGSPEWLATHAVPECTAPAVQRILDAGARLLGKTHTDELAWSLNGQNAHYGTPVNPAAPGRIPGGSSSGSASAVAGGLVDFSIGSDTGGSVRLPASYCGLYGMRPTHGRIPIEGVVPLAPSYDTVGWFARDPVLFARAGSVLLGQTAALPRPRRVLIAEDLFAAAGTSVTNALREPMDRLILLIGSAENVTVAGRDLPAWRNAFRLIQSKEAWAAHGAWITEVKAALGPGVRERFAAAATLDAGEVREAEALREHIRAHMDALLGSDAILALPTVPGIAPLLTTPDSELEMFRARALEGLCPAGHAGLPQISLPLATLDHCPLGLSLIAPRNADEVLLDLAIALTKP